MTSLSKDDEVALKKAFGIAGFGAQMTIRTILNPPPHTRMVGSKSAAAWDSFQDGRVCFLYKNLEDAYKLGADQATHPKNPFLTKSALCQTRVLRSAVDLIDESDMLQISEVDKWTSPAARAAQRGSAWGEAVLRSLLETASSGIDIPWVTPSDHLDVLDIHPHAGDTAIASYALMKDSKFACSYRHCIVQFDYKAVSEGAVFTKKRLLQHIEKEWIQNELPLFDFEAGATGKIEKKRVFPAPLVNPVDTTQLKAIPGCLEAYNGIKQLDFSVCRVTSNGLVKIAPEKLQEFNSANDAVKKAAQEIEKNHIAEFESLLVHMMSEGVNLEDDGDNRHNTNPPEPDPLGQKADETFPSLEELKKSGVEIKGLTKLHGLHSVQMLRDGSNKIWLLAPKDSVVVPKGTILGGYGSGRVREVPKDDMKVGVHVPFELPHGDRTLIILCKTKDAEEDDVTSTKAPETLYKVAKGLQKANQGTSITLAGFGALKPSTEAAGKHGYEVEFPAGHDKFVNYTFELKAVGAGDSKTTTSGNFFLPLASPHGLTGMMHLCWKCSFKGVHFKIAPSKPLVMTTAEMSLKKGEPKLLGGLTPPPPPAA